MIKLISILKEIKVFKHLRSTSVMYNDVKPIMAEYMDMYEVVGNIEHEGDQYYYDFSAELENSDIYNNLAYDLAKYDGFTESFIDLVDIDANFYYNSLAYAFLVKYALEIRVLKFPFHTGFEEAELSSTYNGGDILNNPHLKEMEKYRGQFRFKND